MLEPCIFKRLDVCRLWLKPVQGFKCVAPLKPTGSSLFLQNKFAFGIGVKSLAISNEIIGCSGKLHCFINSWHENH